MKVVFQTVCPKADDAVERYADGLMKAAELQSEARAEAICLLRLN